MFSKLRSANHLLMKDSISALFFKFSWWPYCVQKCVNIQLNELITYSSVRLMRSWNDPSSIFCMLLFFSCNNLAFVSFLKDSLVIALILLWERSLWKKNYNNQGWLYEVNKVEIGKMRSKYTVKKRRWICNGKIWNWNSRVLLKSWKKNHPWIMKEIPFLEANLIFFINSYVK